MSDKGSKRLFPNSSTSEPSPVVQAHQEPSLLVQAHQRPSPSDQAYQEHHHP